jgi:hypothetical protein
LKQDRLRHRSQPAYDSAVAVAVAVPIATTTALASALGHVWQQRKLARALDGARDLALVATAGTGDPPGADLAALGDEPAQGRDVLVVDLVDPVAAIRAGLAPPGGRAALPIAPADRPSTLLRHLASPN